MDIQLIKRKLLERDSNLDKRKLEKIIPKISSLRSDLRIALEKWLINDEYPIIEVEGYTVRKLVTEYHQTIFAAIMTLDFLAREPLLAKKMFSDGCDKIKD